MLTLHLKPGKEKRIDRGHLWAFAGEISEKLSGISPGERVVLRASKGRILGTGYVNPHSLIAVRLVTRGEEVWDNNLVARRIESAFEYRKRVMPGASAYRLVYAESDGLPGLIVDNYDGHLVIQSLTAGIEAILTEISNNLAEIIPVKSIICKGNSPFRKLEGLDGEDRVLLGEPPSEVTFAVESVKYTARITEGQKSGYFLDQSANRRLLKGLAAEKRILDLYCYTGAWGIKALVEGASGAIFVDTSQKALDWGAEDAARNGMSDRSTYIKADVSEFLKGIRAEGRKFDIVILDPPALIPNRSSHGKGIAAYRTVNQLALEVVSIGGYLFSCSCSHHLSKDEHLALIGEASRRSGRRIKIVKTGGHPPDHPILPGHPETEYLKCQVIYCE